MCAHKMKILIKNNAAIHNFLMEVLKYPLIVKLVKNQEVKVFNIFVFVILNVK